MSNNDLQKKYVFKNTYQLICGLVFLAIAIFGYLYSTKHEIYCLFTLVLALYMIWMWSKQRDTSLEVSKKGLHLSNVGVGTKGTIEPILDLPWENVWKMELKKEEQSTMLMVWSTAGQCYAMNITYYALRIRKLKNAIELCSGKPFGAVINDRAQSTGSPAAASGQYEVRCMGVKCGLVDPVTEQVIIPFEYDYIEEEQNDELLAIGKDDRYGFADPKTGRIVIAPKYSNACSFSEGVAAVTRSHANEEVEKWFFIDRDEHIVIEGPFQCAGSFHQGLCPIQKGDKYGYIDHSGRIVIACQYERAFDFAENLAPVAVDKGNGELKYGYINKQGNQVIDFKYQYADTHHEGLATIQLNNRWGYIDTEGRMIIAPQYASALDFENGHAIVTTRGLFGTKLGSKNIKINRRGEKARK